MTRQQRRKLDRLVSDAHAKAKAQVEIENPRPGDLIEMSGKLQAVRKINPVTRELYVSPASKFDRFKFWLRRKLKWLK